MVKQVHHVLLQRKVVAGLFAAAQILATTIMVLLEYQHIPCFISGLREIPLAGICIANQSIWGEENNA